MVKISPSSRARGYVRGPPRGVYVDKDFGTKSKRIGGQLKGRKFSGGPGDRTPVIRDSRGRILGRAPSIYPSQKRVKARPFGKPRMLNIREVGK